MSFHSIVETLTYLGRGLGAYKMTLDCKDKMIPFYESLGYVKEAGNSNTLGIRYPAAAEPKLWDCPWQSCSSDELCDWHCNKGIPGNWTTVGNQHDWETINRLEWKYGLYYHFRDPHAFQSSLTQHWRSGLHPWGSLEGLQKHHNPIQMGWPVSSSLPHTY